MTRPLERRQSVGLFVAIFFAYLLLGGREQPWTDARQIYDVAESLVGHGGVDVQVATGVMRDGKHYAAHPFLASAIHIPGAIIERISARLWPAGETLVRPIACHLGPAAMGALAAVLLLRLFLLLGVARRSATLTAVIAAFATMVMVYARSPYSEIVQTAAYVGFFLALMFWVDAPTVKRALVVGLCAGILCNTKAVFALALPGTAVIAAWRLDRVLGADDVGANLATRVRRLLAPLARHLGAAAIGGVPGIVLLLGYNRIRTGSIFNFGYPVAQVSGPTFGEWTSIGLWGLFFSLGKSVFLYSPPLIAAALALPRALGRRRRDWAYCLLATAGPLVLFYARYTFWHGDWCWGPRYVLFAMPVALVPFAFWHDDMRPTRPVRAGLVGALVFAAGFAVQVVGGAFYWDHFIRLGRDAESQWLGIANRTGAAAKDIGADCGPCFEDMHGLNWLPPFQPIAGHWWLLRHRARGDSAVVAEADAPWHRYTSLKLDVSRTYARARIDLWLLDWKTAQGKAAALVILFVAGAVSGVAAFAWKKRSAAPQPQPMLASQEGPS